MMNTTVAAKLGSVSVGDATSRHLVSDTRTSCHGKARAQPGPARNSRACSTHRSWTIRCGYTGSRGPMRATSAGAQGADVAQGGDPVEGEDGRDLRADASDQRYVVGYGRRGRFDAGLELTLETGNRVAERPGGRGHGAFDLPPPRARGPPDQPDVSLAFRGQHGAQLSALSVRGAGVQGDGLDLGDAPPRLLQLCAEIGGRSDGLVGRDEVSFGLP